MDDPEMPRKSGNRVEDSKRDKSKTDDKCYNLWFTGRCHYGNSCKYPHLTNPERQVRYSPERRFTQGQSGQLFDHGWDQSAQRRGNSATHGGNICPHFAQGRCLQGQDCQFLHLGWGQSEEMRDRPRESCAMQVETRHPSTTTNRSNSGMTVFPHFSEARCTSGLNYRYLHQESYQSEQSRNSPDNSSASRIETWHPRVTNYQSNSGTMVCPYFHNGRCTFGLNCQYLHQGLEQSSQMRDSSFKYRSRPCHYFSQGGCKHGQNCQYLHQNTAQSAEMRHSSAISVQPDRVVSGTNPKYKTKLCTEWERRNYCPRVICNYAHGEAELRGFAPSHASASQSTSIAPRTLTEKNDLPDNSKATEETVPRGKKMAGIYADWIDNEEPPRRFDSDRSPPSKRQR